MHPLQKAYKVNARLGNTAGPYAHYEEVSLFIVVIVVVVVVAVVMVVVMAVVAAVV